jgi:membrane-bound serine protease (ClpP class)
MKMIFLFLSLPMVFALANPEKSAEKAQEKPPAACTKQVSITDVIGPGTVDLLKRVESRAEQEKCASILLLVNTPGGSLQSTRFIVEMILNSPRPYLCLISPSGGHAGSAGAIILQACHVNGGLHGTNLGAATPVTMQGDLPKDLRQKILNDTRSWLESLTRLRGRSDKFGQDIILEAKAVTAEDALKLKAIDFVGPTLAEFLKFAEGRQVKMTDSKMEAVRTGPLSDFAHDTRHKVVSLLTDPQFAYMLLLGSLALLYFEITHPGTMVAGVLGALGLIIAMVALDKLDVEYGGLALILLGIALLIAEIFVPSFGILGVGGITAFVLGSIFLFDPVKSFGYRLPLTLIAPVVIMSAGVFIGVSYLMLKTRAVKKMGGFEDLMDLEAQVVRLENPLEGTIELRGELWKFKATAPVQINDKVMVTGHKDLVLFVTITKT